MTTPIYVFGSSGMSVECARLALATGLYHIAAFVEADDRPRVDTIEINPSLIIPVISETELVDKAHTESEPLKTMLPMTSAPICRKILDRFGTVCEFPNVIHPSAALLDIAGIGRGNIIFQYAQLSWRVRLGDFNKILPMTTIGHETIIGSFNSLLHKSTVAGCVKIANDNLLGSGCMVRQGTIIGSHNTVGMGAAVVKDIKDGETWVGVPAKRIK